VVLITYNCTIKKIADRGRPGTVSHAIELEVKVPRREVFRLIVPFIVASMFAANIKD